MFVQLCNDNKGVRILFYSTKPTGPGWLDCRMFFSNIHIVCCIHNSHSFMWLSGCYYLIDNTKTKIFCFIVSWTFLERLKEYLVPSPSRPGPEHHVIQSRARHLTHTQQFFHICSELCLYTIESLLKHSFCAKNTQPLTSQSQHLLNSHHLSLPSE